MATATQRQPAAKRTKKSSARPITTKPPAERKMLVFGTLLGVLTLTSALLLALSPAPLTPDAANNLFAVDDVDWPAVLFKTDRPIESDRWKYIYIHQSKTPDGSAATLAGTGASGMADHFLIGNGEGGASDGQIQIGQRWTQQAMAAPPAGTQANGVWPSCISVCVVGDFERGLPTALQMRRLEKLTLALQAQLHVPADNVILMADAATAPTAGGIGRYFPVAAFRGKLAANP